ncbi:MAG: YncE family protein [Streptosporangiaceae bacterium]
MKHLNRVLLMLRRRRALTALALTGFAALCLVPVGAAAAAGTVPHRAAAAPAAARHELPWLARYSGLSKAELARLERIPDRMRLAAGRGAALSGAARAATAAAGRRGNWHGGSSPGPAVPVGNGPVFTALNPATRTLYVANIDDNTVSVINTATCNAAVTSGCGQTPPTVQTGSGPVAIAIDQASDTIYVANVNDGTVSVINGATCNAQKTSGCGQVPPTVTVGSGPDALALDQATSTLYVANGNDTSVSVINTATCNAKKTSGCGQTPATMQAGSGPSAIAVDPATRTVYVANFNDNTVSVVNGATCNAQNTSGCGQTPPTTPAGSAPVAIAMDQAVGTVYVANIDDNTLSMINKAACNAKVTSGCGKTPPVVHVGAEPDGVAVDNITGTIYESNYWDATVSAIDAASCNATTTAGCGTQPVGSLRSGGGTNYVTVDPATGTIYTPNSITAFISYNSVSVLNGITCNAVITAGCTRFPATVPVGGNPAEPAVDDATHTVYVSNSADGTVSVVNSAACNATVTAGCLTSVVATVPVGSNPLYLAVDQATDTVYVPNANDNTVSVINGKTCNATVTSGCGQTSPVIAVPGGPGVIAVNELTDSVYVGTGAGTVAVINGAACNSAVTTGCSQTPATVTTGDWNIGDIAVNPQTNTIYTANNAPSPADDVSVIDGVTCNGTNTSGCSQIPPTATGVLGSGSVAVDQHTNTVYDTATTTVAMINGSTCDATVTTGCSQTPPEFTAGNFPYVVRVDQRTNMVYVANFVDNSVSIVDGLNCNATNTAGCGRSFPVVPVGGFPSGLAVSEAAGTVYVPNYFDNNVSVFGPNFAQK